MHPEPLNAAKLLQVYYGERDTLDQTTDMRCRGNIFRF